MAQQSLARKIASIQRLCCLGLGGQILIPRVLRELENLIPSSGVTPA